MSDKAIDPDQLWQKIMDLSRTGAEGRPSGIQAVNALRELEESLAAMHQHLIRNGRFPSVWTNEPRRQMDGPAEFTLSKTVPGHLTRHILEIREQERVPLVTIPDGPLAVDTLEAIRHVYRLGRREAWQERT